MNRLIKKILIFLWLKTKEIGIGIAIIGSVIAVAMALGGAVMGVGWLECRFLPPNIIDFLRGNTVGMDMWWRVGGLTTLAPFFIVIILTIFCGWIKTNWDEAEDKM